MESINVKLRRTHQGMSLRPLKSWPERLRTAMEGARYCGLALGGAPGLELFTEEQFAGLEEKLRGVSRMERVAAFYMSMVCILEPGSRVIHISERLAEGAGFADEAVLALSGDRLYLVPPERLEALILFSNKK